MQETWVSFRVDWVELLAVQGTLKSLFQHHSSKASILRQGASRAAPGKSGLHARGEGERWEGLGAGGEGGDRG